MRLLDRTIAELDRRLLILAPAGDDLPESFQNVTASPLRHSDLLAGVQRLRGAVYLEDGAVQQHQLLPGGRHETPEDADSWHIVFVDSAGDVTACVRYRHHSSATLAELRVLHCPLLSMPSRHEWLQRKVESEIAAAASESIGIAEIGGWAVSKRNRCTSEGLLLALAVFSLSGALGEGIGIATATVRHSSSLILRRFGGAPLMMDDGRELPPYFDATYRCMMELLRFDSRRPNPKYAPLERTLRQKLETVLVLADAPALAPAAYLRSRMEQSPQYAA